MTDLEQTIRLKVGNFKGLLVSVKDRCTNKPKIQQQIDNLDIVYKYPYLIAMFAQVLDEYKAKGIADPFTALVEEHSKSFGVTLQKEEHEKMSRYFQFFVEVSALIKAKNAKMPAPPAGDDFHDA